MKFLFLSLFYFYSHGLVTHSHTSKNIRGGVNGGGADYGYSDYTAWFLRGYKPHVDICVLKSEDFGVEDEKIEVILKNSYQIWDRYILNNDIYDESDDDFDPELMKFQNNIKVSFSPKCKNSDLELYLGLENEEIRKLKSKFNDPLAFAHKVEAFDDQGWSKGLIWIKSLRDAQWDKHKNLEMILLHEIGHTMGVSHKSETIMTSQIANYIDDSIFGNPDEDSLLKKEKIDWDTKLINCFFCEGNLGNLWLPGSRHEALVFEKLTGKKLEANSKLKTEFVNLSQESLKKKNQDKITGELLLSEGDQKEYRFNLSFMARNLSFKPMQEKIFSRQREIKNSDGSSSTYFSDSGGMDIAYILGEIEIRGKKHSFIAENGLYSNIILPPVGEVEGNRLYSSLDGVSVYFIDNLEKYYLYSNIKVYELENK